MGRTDPESRVMAGDALRLLLDASPLGLLAGYCCSLFGMFAEWPAPQWLIQAGIWSFLLGAVPLCILGRILRRRMDGAEESHAGIARASRILWMLGAIAACWSVLALFLCLLNVIRI